MTHQLQNNICSLVTYRAAIINLMYAADNALDTLSVSQWQYHFKDASFRYNELSPFWHDVTQKKEHENIATVAKLSGLSTEQVCTFVNMFPPKFLEMSECADDFLLTSNSDYRLKMAHINQDVAQLVSHAWLSDFLLTSSNRKPDSQRSHFQPSALFEKPQDKHLKFFDIIQNAEDLKLTCDDLWQTIFNDCNPNGQYSLYGISNQVFDDVSDIFKDIALEVRKGKDFITPNIVLAYLDGMNFDYKSYYQKQLALGKKSMCYDDLPKDICDVVNQLCNYSDYPQKIRFDLPDHNDPSLDNPKSLKKTITLNALENIVNLYRGLSR